MLKGIIFDFDGVIAQSLEIKSDAFRKLYENYGKEVASQVVTHHEANGGISRFEKIKYYHNEFLGIELKHDDISNLANKFSKIIIEQVINCTYVPGVLDYLNKFFSKKELFISTGTPSDEIKIILRKKKIDHYFSGIFGSPSEKTEHIKKILFDYNFNPEELIFFGDSLTDMESAQIFKIPFILIRNSFNKKIFKNYNGNAIDNFMEIL